MSAPTVLALVYGILLVALLAHGANCYALLVLRRRWRPPRVREATEWPHVTVQIPIYDERDVVTRVIEATGRLRYPGRIDVQVLDDSDDDTSALASLALRRLEATGLQVAHLRRGGREGFKAGALAYGLARTTAEAILVLDADFVPPPDFLLRTVPLLADEDAAFVQARWGHLNRDRSALTRGQALAIDAHFAIEQRARAAPGWPLSFNGSAGLWRRAAIEDAGGWSADTLTEDLDLSYRAWLRGWSAVYADDVVCPAEIPERMAAFKAQQRRWAQGSTATARKLVGPIWRSRAPFWAKVQATLHLTHYGVHPLILLSAALALPFGLCAPAASAWWTVLPPLAVATGGPVAMALAAARDAGMPWRRRARDVAALMVLGTGLAVSNSVGVVRGLSGRRPVFERTPKGGTGSSYLAGADPCGLAEILCAVGCAVLGVWLASKGLVSFVPFLALYAGGLGRVGLATLQGTWRSGARAATLPDGA